MSSQQHQPRSVIFVPGGTLPAALQYQPLLTALNGEVRPFLKDLEVYAGDEPPKDYRLDQEIEGVRRFAESNALSRFDLVAYSGGAAVVLAFVARFPEMVTSLALTEPAVIPSQQWFDEESAYRAGFEQVMLLPPPEQMREFVRLHLRSGVPPPPSPSRPAPAWMAKRPAGLKAMAHAFTSYDLNLADLRRFDRPVYFALGSLTASFEERMAEKLGTLFPNFRLEVYEGRHHFDPPQRAEPERYARALRELWQGAPQ